VTSHRLSPRRLPAQILILAESFNRSALDEPHIVHAGPGPVTIDVNRIAAALNHFYLTRGVQWSTIEIVQTVVETPTYLAIANKLFSEDERADIVALVAADPECGDLIRGTGGFRKVRVARRGMGKSGGARVVYIWRNERFPVFLITAFPKNEKENLSMAERNALKKRADSIFEAYGR
jgi:hypothetical protein